MKKLWFSILILVCVTGCQTSNENKQLLYGEWEYRKKPQSYEGGWGDVYRYEFSEDGSVNYFECLHLILSDDGCADGSSVWKGKYSIKGNVVTMKNFEIDQSSYKPSTKLTDPKEQVIVSFDDMYLCDRQSGLDCKIQFEKVVD